MIEEIKKNFYKVKIPIPWSPLKTVNSYIVKSSSRNLIIDTGWNREECMNAMMAVLSELKVDLKKTDFFITHLHADHIGLIWNLATKTSTVYFNQPDAILVESDRGMDNFINFARKNGFPENELEVVHGSDPGYKYGIKGPLPFSILREGDTIGVGDYLFQCVETPGHTPGHMCLYEPYEKLFLAGDNILNDITPNIQLLSDERNPLEEYLGSLNKISNFDVKLILPGHRDIFSNFKERIEELKNHHQNRLSEVLIILEGKDKNSYEVASQMSWDIAIECRSWDKFPVLQKWFATSEAIAHLKYLEEQGFIRRQERGQNIVFTLNTDYSGTKEL